MEPTTKARPPVVMTIREMFQQLATVMERAAAQERDEFKKAWLDSSADFNKRTDETRCENWKRS